MASFVIEGGHRLCGEIHPQGAKNEVLQIICATLLTAEEVTVNNIPDILDVNNLIQLLREMGVTVAKKGIDSYSFKAENVDLAYLESDEFLKKCSSLRGSVMLIGPMVARFGKALISKPGGDKIAVADWTPISSASKLWAQISATTKSGESMKLPLAGSKATTCCWTKHPSPEPPIS